MTQFSDLPNKKLGGQTTDVWPDLGESFVLNSFYHQFDGAEGWLGDSFFAVWSRQEIIEFRPKIMEAYPEKYHFFGSDGGGTKFGFILDSGNVVFCPAPDIGDEEDIRALGNWDEFIQSVKQSDYI